MMTLAEERWRGTGRERVWGGWGEDSVGLLLSNVLCGVGHRAPLLCSPGEGPQKQRAERLAYPNGAREMWEPGEPGVWRELGDP